jgi:hypothetical protein
LISGGFAEFLRRRVGVLVDKGARALMVGCRRLDSCIESS